MKLNGTHESIKYISYHIYTSTKKKKSNKKHTYFNSKHSDMLEKLPIIHEFTPTHITVKKHMHK